MTSQVNNETTPLIIPEIEIKPVVVEEKPVQIQPEPQKIQQINYSDLLCNNWMSVGKYQYK